MRKQGTSQIRIKRRQLQKCGIGDTKKASEQNKYYKFHSRVLLKRQQAYYGSLTCQRAAKVLR